MAVTCVTRRVAWRRGSALGLLVVAGTVNYLDRSAVSVANGPIRHSLGLSIAEMGVLLSAFAWAYGVAQVPVGLLVDRFGSRRMLGIGLLVWSAAQVASAFSWSLGAFALARAALGAGEAPMYLGGTRVLADWYPEDRRTVPIAVFNASASLGPAIAPAGLTLVMAAFGWRAMFASIGVLGVVVAAAWIASYRGPREAGLSDAELASTGDGEAPPSEATPALEDIRGLLSHRSSWGMTIGFAGVIYMVWLFATWLPGYLETQRHLGTEAAGLLTSIPLGAGFLGALAGGWVASGLQRTGLDPRAACRWPVIGGMLAAGAFTVAGAVAPGVAGAIALLSGGVFAANLASSCGWALGAVMAPPSKVGTLEAIQNVGGSVGGGLAPLLTGIVVQATGSFTPALFGAAAISVATALVYLLMVRDRVG